MSKIERSEKFQALLQRFREGSSKLPKEPEKAPEPVRKESLIPQSVRKSARDVKQPRRYDASPIQKPIRATPTLKPARLKQTCPEIQKPAVNQKREAARERERAPPTMEDGSDEEFPDSASAVQSPPRASAFSKVADRGIPAEVNGDAQFLRPEIPKNRDPRRQQSRQEVRRDIPSDDFRREASFRQPLSSREYSIRPPMQSREASMRQNYAEAELSFSTRQPVVRLNDITRSREFSRHWSDGFLRPPTPPEVLDMVKIEKCKMLESIQALINCTHFNALEIIYTLNYIEHTLITKADKFCRKQEKAQSILRNTMSETPLEMSSARDQHREVQAWLDGVGPAANQTSSRVNKRQQGYIANDRAFSKRPKLHNYSRFNDYEYY